jgi:hypothetical protein
MEIAAGVMPGMRLACPIDTGRMRVSFSTISLDKPGMVAKSIFDGIRFVSAFRSFSTSRACAEGSLHT